MHEQIAANALSEIREISGGVKKWFGQQFRCSTLGHTPTVTFLSAPLIALAVELSFFSGIFSFAFSAFAIRIRLPLSGPRRHLFLALPRWSRRHHRRTHLYEVDVHCWHSRTQHCLLEIRENHVAFTYLSSEKMGRKGWRFI